MDKELFTELTQSLKEAATISHKLNSLTLKTFKKTDEGKELNSYSKIEEFLEKMKCQSVL